MAFITIALMPFLGWIVLAVLAIFGIGSVILQILLSNMENRWAGLILPSIVCFICLVSAIQVAIEIDASIYSAVISFLVVNIVTVFYLLIYVIVRMIKKLKKSDNVPPKRH